LPAGAAAYSMRVPLIVAAAFFMETLAMSLGISAYLVAVAVFVPTAGWVSDRYSARNVFAAAIGVFTIASLMCGLSPSFWTFIVSRILQGAAAAFMSPVGRLVVLRETPKNRLIESMGMIVWSASLHPAA